MDSYYEQRDIENTIKLRQLRSELPMFCSEFFIGIESNTSTLTRMNYAYDLKTFFHFMTSEIYEFKSKKIAELNLDDLSRITTTHLELFLEYLSAFKINGVLHRNSAEGKARKISAVRALFKYLYNKNKLETDVSARIVMPKLHDKPIIRLEVDEVVKMLNNAQNGVGLTQRQKKFHDITALRDVAILTLFLGTGIRISELVGLDVDSIDLENNSFIVTRKGGKKEILYFSDEVAAELERYLQHRNNIETIDKNEKALFLSIQKKRIGVRSVEELVKKYAQITTPLKHITPHKLRSTYGTNLYRETQDIYVVATVLGHKDINTTRKHYAALSEDIKRNASTKVKLRDDD